MNSEAHGPKSVRALLVINAQRDYFEDGSLPIPKAECILPVIQKLRTHTFDYCIFSKLWHAANQCSFSSNNPGYQVSDIVTFTHLGSIEMIPDLCVAATSGSEIHPSLPLRPDDLVLCCGTNPGSNSYSIFTESGPDGSVPISNLIERTGINELFLCGPCFEEGVQYTAFDANVKTGCAIYIIKDACSLRLPEQASETWSKLSENEGIHVILSTDSVIDRIPVRLSSNVATLDCPLDYIRYFNDSSPTIKKFEVDAPLWAEIPHQVTGFPDFLKDFKFIVSYHADRSISEQNYLSIRAKLRTNVYVLISKLNSTPSWIISSMRKSSATVTVFPPLFSMDIWELPALVPGQGFTFGPSGADRKARGQTSCVILFKTAEPDPADIEYMIKNQTIKDVEFVQKNCSIEGTYEPLFHRNPLHIAATLGKSDVVNYFQSQGLLMEQLADEVDDNGDTPLILACRGNHTSVIQDLIHYSSNSINTLSATDGMSALMISAAFGNRIAVEEILIDGVCDPTQLSLQRKSALTYALNNIKKTALPLVKMILSAIPNDDSRKKLLEIPDVQGWSSLHIACKYGLLQRLPYTLLEFEQKSLNINAMTFRQYSLLHLAVWNNQPKAVQFIVSPPYTLEAWEVPPQLNVQASESGFVELDLAIMKHFSLCARCLILAGYRTLRWNGDRALEFLIEMILIGDYKCVEGLLRFDENKISINDYMLKTVRRMKTLNACTFSFSGFTNPVSQFLYQCTVCQTSVCLICAATCHRHVSKKLTVRPLGLVPDSYCSCSKTTCQALSGPERRDAEGRRFDPRPIDTSFTPDDEEMRYLSKCLAKNAHSIWICKQKEAGWKPGPVMDEEQRTNPLLVPWESLPVSAIKSKIRIIYETLKVMNQFGFSFECSNKRGVDQFLNKFYNDQDDENFMPDTIDTGEVTVPNDIRSILELLASNHHVLWALMKIQEGWRYPTANTVEKLKNSRMLVPFEYLNESEKQISRSAVEQIVKVSLAIGYRVTLNENYQALLFNHFSEDTSSRSTSIDKYKSLIYSIFVRTASRLGQCDFITQIYSAMEKSNNFMNQQDRYGHTPLYLAVKRGHFSVVEKLIMLNVKIDVADNNGLTPLILSAFLGNLEIVSFLLQKGASIMAKDGRGLTAVHHACAKGHDKVLKVLLRFLPSPISELTSRPPQVDSAPSSSRMCSCCRRPKPSAPIQPVMSSEVEESQGSEYMGMSGLATFSVMENRGQSRKLSSFFGRSKTFVDSYVSQSALPENSSVPYMTTVFTSFFNFSANVHVKVSPLVFDQPPLPEYSPLNIAVKAGKNSIIPILLENGVNPTEADVTGVSPSERVLLKQMVSALHTLKEISSHAIRLSDESQKREESFLSHVNPAWEKAIEKDIGTEENHGVIHSIELCSESVEIISRSGFVKSKQTGLSLWLFLYRAIFFVFLLLVFLCFTSLFPTYSSDKEISMKEVLQSDFESELEGVTYMKDVLTVFYLFLADEKKFVDVDDHYYAYRSENFLLGSIRITQTIYQSYPCTTQDYITFSSPPNCIGSSDTVLMEDIPSSNRKTALNKIQELIDSEWLSPNVHSVSFSFAFYNLNDQIFLAATTSSQIDKTGLITATSKEYTGRVFQQYPPNRWFEIVLGIEILFEAYLKIKVILLTKQCRSLLTGWNLFEWFLLLFGLALIIMDAFVFTSLYSMHLDMISNDYIPLNEFASNLYLEVDLFSLFLLLYCCRFIKFLRLIPTWGPMILAVVLTIKDLTVVLYLVVLVWIMLVFAFLFGVSNGPVNDEFSDLANSFITLFRTSFTNEFGIYDFTNERPLGYLFYFFYVIIGLILINLLIGIVANVYPEIRDRSVLQWKLMISQYMTDSVLEGQQQSKGQLRRPSAIWGLNDDDYWGTLMDGMDGCNYWTADGLQSKHEYSSAQRLETQMKKEESEDVEYVTILDHVKKRNDDINTIKSHISQYEVPIDNISLQVEKILSVLKDVNDKEKERSKTQEQESFRKLKAKAEFT